MAKDNDSPTECDLVAIADGLDKNRVPTPARHAEQCKVQGLVSCHYISTRQSALASEDKQGLFIGPLGLPPVAVDDMAACGDKVFSFVCKEKNARPKTSLI